MVGNPEALAQYAIQREYEAALEDGNDELAERIALANPDMFPKE